jgi:hypothetical protein
MSFQVSAVAAQIPLNPMPETKRRTANFPPSIWGDRFLKSASELVIKNKCI